MVGSEIPAQLELVRSFVNTLEVEDGTDALATPAGLSAWVVEHGLTAESVIPTRADVRRAAELREALRSHLLANNGATLPASAVETVARQAERSGVAVVFEGGAASVASTTSGVDGALGRILAAVATAMLEGTWRRLKACAADDCRWAFVDRSRNHSRHWCAMGVCGNRQKVRAFRARQR